MLGRRGLVYMYTKFKSGEWHGYFTFKTKNIIIIHASMLASVLGIHREALLRISNTQYYEFRISGRFLLLYHAIRHKC